MKLLAIILILVLLFNWEKLSSAWKFVLIFLIILSWSYYKMPKANLDIVPNPQKVEMLGGRDCRINKHTVIVVTDSVNSFNAEYLQSHLKNAFKGDFTIVSDCPKSHFIAIELNDTVEMPEAYNLLVSKKGIRIVAGSAKGAFYGIQTLLQMMPEGI